MNVLRYKLLLIALLIVGCYMPPPTSESIEPKKEPATLTFEIGMTLEDFKTKNKNVNGLEIVYADENNIVYKKVNTSNLPLRAEVIRTLSELPVPFLYFKNGILIKQIVQPSNTTLDFN